MILLLAWPLFYLEPVEPVNNIYARHTANGERKYPGEMDRGGLFALSRLRGFRGVSGLDEDRGTGLNKERADPALIICLITAAYEGFQTPLQQVLPILTIGYQGVSANKKRA